MAEVSLEIGGNHYKVACRDGEEAHLRALAALVDSKAQDARKAVGGVNETRQLLFAALLLADELHESRSSNGSAAPVSAPPAPATADPAFAEALLHLAERLEGLATSLEKRAGNA